MTAQAWNKAAAHTTVSQLQPVRALKLLFIKNGSRFYKVIKHPSPLPSEIVNLVFYARICKKLPYLQHISTKIYMKTVIRQAINIQERNSLSPPWAGVLKHYSELLCRVEKGAYRDVCSSNCSSRLSSKSLLPFMVSNACGPSSSKVIWNTCLGIYSIKEQRSILKISGEEVVLCYYSYAEYQIKEGLFPAIFFYLCIDILVTQDAQFVQEKALWSSECLFYRFKSSLSSLHWSLK